jgi:site-specific DNA recombinase
MANRVVLYTRVSTTDQADFGFSLEYQENTLKKYCKIKNETVVKVFTEDVSGKTFNRPEWNKLLAFVKANKKTIDMVYLLRWDRFGRNTPEAYANLEILRKLGVGVQAIEQPLDLSKPDDHLMLAFHLAIPEVENRKNSIRTTEGSRTARLSGCWTGKAPIGYDNVRDIAERSTLIPNDKIQLVVEAFKEVSKNQKSVDAIRKEMTKKGLRLTKQGFLNMLRNVVYTGKIKVKEYKKDEEVVVTGLHPAIIDDFTFNLVQQVLKGKKNVNQKSHKEDANFPLRGFILCPCCNKPLTGGASKGRKKYYNYYKCQNNCIPNIPAESGNDQFVKFLASIKPSFEVVELYQLMLKDIFKSNGKDKRDKIQKLKKSKEESESALKSAYEKYFEGRLIDERTFNNATQLFEKKIADINTDIEMLKNEPEDVDRHTEFALPFLTNLDFHYKQSDLNTKKFIIGSIFPEKIYYSEKGYRTTSMNRVLALLTNTNGHSELLGNKKALKNQGLTNKAPQTGLEPVTL